MIRIPLVKFLLVVFLQCADVVLLAYNDCSNPYLAGTLVLLGKAFVQGGLDTVFTFKPRLRLVGYQIVYHSRSCSNSRFLF